MQRAGIRSEKWIICDGFIAHISAKAVKFDTLLLLQKSCQTLQNHLNILKKHA
jgi:hypothetical protein